MIGWLKGRIIDKHQPGKLVVDVNGVGYDVETSLTTFFQLESNPTEVGLHIHTVVREDAFLLYGFLDREERSLFRALIKVNGVGPKLAIAILSSTTPDELIQCIQQQKSHLLTRLPGIGKKTAERLVVEMKDSLDEMPHTGSQQKSFIGTVTEKDEAIKALEALGYKSQEAVNTIKKIDDGNKNCEQLIREGLKQLAKV